MNAKQWYQRSTWGENTMASLMLSALPIPMASRSLISSFSNLSFSHFEILSVSASIPPVFVSLPSSSPTLRIIYCGRGDRKTARGKRFIGSYGNSRPRNKKKGRGLPKIPIPPGPPRNVELDEFDLDDSPIELDDDILADELAYETETETESPLDD